MKVIFYYDERSMNDATIYYIKTVEKAFFELGISMQYCTKIKKVKKDDFIFTISAFYHCKARIRFPFNKTIFWAQGVGPEEYKMLNSKFIIYYLKTLFEFISIRFSTVLFVVSNKMLEHYQQKYKYVKNNFLVMPCYNLIYNNGLAIKTKERYLQPKFVYAGNLSTWQCVEETLKIYKYIEAVIPHASLTLLVKEHDMALEMIKKYSLKNVAVKYVKLSKLQDELSQYKYGFIIREDNVVNNVATPTKMNSYLASALIPIYTDAVDSFRENILLDEYTICLTANSSVDYKANVILNFEQNTIIQAELLDDKIIDVFFKYYNEDIYLNHIQNKLNDELKL